MKVSNLNRFGAPASIALLLSLFSSVALAQEKIFKDDIQSFDMNQANAEEVAGILNKQFPLQLNEFSANKSTNTIYVRIPKELVPEVQEFIDRLELEAEKTKAEEAARNEAKMAKEARQQSDRDLTLKIYTLRHADAEELLNVIGELWFHNQQISIAAAPGTNSIVARGDVGSLKEIEALLLNLDRPGEAISGSERFDGDELLRLKREYQSLLSPFNDSDPKVLELKRQIESIQQTRRDSDLQQLANPGDAGLESRIQKEYDAAEQASDRLASQWRTENNKKDRNESRLDALRAQLKQQVTAAYRLRQQLKISQIQRAAEQLQTIRSRLQQRDQIADKIVASRIDDLLGTAALPGQKTESHTASDAKPSEPARPVQVEVADGGVIMLRGRKDDVDILVEAFKEMQEKGSGAAKSVAVQGVVKSVDPFAADQVEISVGSDDGIKQGDVLGVRRDGTIVARLQVAAVSSDSATARILNKTDYIGEGNEICLIEENSGETPATKP